MTSEELLMRLRSAIEDVRNPYSATGVRHTAFIAGLGAAWEAIQKAVESMPEPPQAPDPADIRLALDSLDRGWAPPEVQGACRRLRKAVAHA